MPTPLHKERLDSVVSQLVKLKARQVIDLGCGSGELLSRLLEKNQFEKIVGVDSSTASLKAAEISLQSRQTNWRERVSLVNSSFLDLNFHAIFDAAVLVESIEHIDGRYLSKLERSVFQYVAPKSVIVTTPNREYNVILGVPDNRLRHPEHCFEWDRRQFESWCERVGQSFRYAFQIYSIGPSHLYFGSPTQMAVFTRSLK